MTTLQTFKLSCPLCGNKFDTNLITSTNSFGPLHSDLYREASGVQPICYFVHTCDHCGYSGFDGDFQPEKFLAEFKELVAENITPEVKGKGIPVNGNYLLAALCAEWRGAEPRSLGRIYHMGAWCMRSRKDKEKEKYYLQKAVEQFQKAVESGDVKGRDKPMFTYLVGDIYRRIGEAEKAKEWYSKVEAEVKKSDGERKLVEFARRQLTDPVDIFT